jgi:hypothetical protein
MMPKWGRRNISGSNGIMIKVRAMSLITILVSGVGRHAAVRRFSIGEIKFPDRIGAVPNNNAFLALLKHRYAPIVRGGAHDKGI